MCVSTIEIQTSGPISMKFGTVEDHHDPTMVCMCSKKSDLRLTLKLENISWPKHALCRKFHKRKVIWHTQQWGYALNIFG